MRDQWKRLLALVFAFSMVAAACGGDSTSSTDGESGETEAAEGGEEESDAGGVDVDEAEEQMAAEEEEEGAMEEEEDDGAMMEEATDIDGLEAEWAATREGIVAAIVDGGYGIDDGNILQGPGGMAVDLNECPADWSETEGLTDDTLRIGHMAVLSGNLAAYGNLSVGFETYIDYVNDKFGGIGDRNIEVVIKDDAYVATQTIELVDEMLQSDKPFYIATLGSPNTLAVYDTLNEKCVPHPFAQTGHPAWGDPIVHPWTSGLQMSYSTEAILWGAWIKQNLADDLPVSVAGLVMDNDFGLAYEDGMQKYADANPDVIAEFTAVRHDPAAPTVTNEMTTIAAQNPDVFISMTAGNPCLLAVEESGRSGLIETAKALFAPSVCKDANAYMIPAGDVGDGFYVVGGGAKVYTDPQYEDDVYVQFVQNTIEAAGLDNTVGLIGTGFGQFAWAHIEVLRVADALPGGLTRTNYMLALRSFESAHPGLLDGITFGVNGAADGYFIEGSEVSQYDAANESWIQVGNVVDLNGSSPNCTWGDTGC